MALGYFVVLGAPASLSALELTLREACQDLELEPWLGGRLREAPPEAEHMVYFGLRPDARPLSQLGPGGGDCGFVTRRHTPTALLRRLIALTAARFGAVQLLVTLHDMGSPAQPFRVSRTASTTLAGFLRSGRVVQEDTWLDVRNTPEPSRRRLREPLQGAPGVRDAARCGGSTQPHRAHSPELRTNASKRHNAAR